MVLVLGSVLLSFSGLVSAVTYCWTGESILPTITSLADLRTATPFTYSDLVSVYNCSVDPLVLSFTNPVTYYTTWYNAFVGGTLFPCPSPVVESFSIYTSTYTYEQYVFPGLTVTSLTPGQIISWTLLPPITGVSTGYYKYNISFLEVVDISLIVPTNALTLAPSTSAPVVPTTPTPLVTLPPATATTHNSGVGSTVLPPTETSSPSPSPSSSGSSVNVGAIAGGAIGGVVLLGAIFVLAWYKVRTHDRNVRESVLPPVEQYNPSPGPGPSGSGVGHGGAGYAGGYGEKAPPVSPKYYGQNPPEEMLPISPTLRYPDPDANMVREEIPSGNVGNKHY